MNKVRVPPLAPSRTVLLLVDFVNPLTFPGAERLAPSALAAARRTAALRRRLTGEGVRTVYANDNYGLWSADFRALWRACAARQDAAGRIARVLRPRSDDFAVLKPRHSAFYATPLEILLKQLACKRLIVTGIAADNCVLFSAMDAYLRGYSLWVPVDCVAAESADARDRALDQVQRVLKARIAPTADGQR